jgi:hypothetical protein
MGSTGDSRSPIERFGAYEVHERLGVGGMATVHRALERGVAGFERWVALKRLLPAISADEDLVASFIREARLASRLSHANIVKIYELGQVGDDYFISMEYIEGVDLRRVLRRARLAAGPPPLVVICALLGELLDALDYAHRKADDGGRPLGLVHRDIAPSNLIIDGAGHLKVIDFGIAKASGDNVLTQSGLIKGKLGYVAPEALHGQERDARSDLFSVGVIAHELLTVRPLFAAKTDYDTIQRVLHLDPQPPSAFNTNCPPEVDDLVLTALERNRGERWQSARDMLDALGDLVQAYHVQPAHREVASWIEWAFALPEARREPEAAAIELPGRRPRAATEADLELLELIWGAAGAGTGDPDDLPEISVEVGGDGAAAAKEESVDDGWRTEPSTSLPEMDAEDGDFEDTVPADAAPGGEAPVDEPVILLRPGVAPKKRITARTSVPPLPQPNEPLVAVMTAPAPEADREPPQPVPHAAPEPEPPPPPPPPPAVTPHPWPAYPVQPMFSPPGDAGKRSMALPTVLIALAVVALAGSVIAYFLTI